MLDPTFLRRRHFLGVSALGGLATVLGGLPRSLFATGAPRRGKAKNVLVIFEQGGLSQVDTWDPKPHAPAEHRSPFKPIATRVPGMQFTELLPHSARIADKLAVVRSMHHNGLETHDCSSRYMLSGFHPNPRDLTAIPDIGSVVVHRQGSECKYLPPHIMVPGNSGLLVTSSGFLSSSTRVYKTGGHDVSAPDWKIANLAPRLENTGARLETRRELLNKLSGGKNIQGSSAGSMDRFRAEALDMLASSRMSAAFDLKTEPAAVREKYGHGHRGACYLVGRKLVEAGVRFVTVHGNWPLTAETPGGFLLDWDHHDTIYAKGSCGTVRDKNGGEGRYGIGHYCMMGSTDQAFAALIEDLDQRGLLAETLVCFVSEFGRTPRLNNSAGRDHWSKAYSIVFAGAGVPGGQVIGSTDKEGGHVTNEPHTPEDYAATIYEKLGIDRTQPLYTATRRPVYFEGEPIPGLF